MKDGDPYCGFLCVDMIERQNRIMQDLNDFAVYNPGYAQVMRMKILKICLHETLNHVEEEEKTKEPIAINQ